MLKRAYADVILNTTKESAVRILAAERRTLQWKQSSSLVKEDSVALILRLKALMDSRVIVFVYLQLVLARSNPNFYLFI